MAQSAQCPFCELRFSADWEVKTHIDAEHPGRIRDKDDAEIEVPEDLDGDGEVDLKPL